MVYGYARVSTRGQARDGNGLEVQTEELKRANCQKIYKESYTGTKDKRPVLDALMTVLKPGDTIVVTKLDRIARSARGGIFIIDQIVEKGCAIDVLNMGKFDSSPMGKLMRTMMFAFAEFERDMIVERTTEGKKIARLDENYREGRPRKDFTSGTIKYYREKQMSHEMTIEQICKALGISRRSWFNRLKEMQWT